MLSWDSQTHLSCSNWFKLYGKSAWVYNTATPFVTTQDTSLDSHIKVLEGFTAALYDDGDYRILKCWTVQQARWFKTAYSILNCSWSTTFFTVLSLHISSTHNRPLLPHFLTLVLNIRYYIILAHLCKEAHHIQNTSIISHMVVPLWQTKGNIVHASSLIHGLGNSVPEMMSNKIH